MRRIVAAAALMLGLAAVQPAAAENWKDPSPHQVRFIEVEHDVRLEVLDWGGTGRPVVLLAGLGDSAHVYDEFAPKLARQFHVYAITRRGFGASSAPASGYSAKRLGEDVLAVVNALKLNRPVVAGHSIAGEELSVLGTHHTQAIAGLVYLDAVWSYAFDNGLMTPVAQYQELFSRVQEQQGSGPDPKTFEAMRENESQTRGVALPAAEFHQRGTLGPDGQIKWREPRPDILEAITSDGPKFTQLHAPVLAISAYPQSFGAVDRSSGAEARAALAQLQAWKDKDLSTFARSVPNAKLVRLPGNHYIFIAHESEVLREMSSFISQLPR